MFAHLVGHRKSDKNPDNDNLKVISITVPLLKLSFYIKVKILWDNSMGNSHGG